MLSRVLPARAALLLLVSWMVLDLAIVHTCVLDEGCDPPAPSAAGPSIEGTGPGHDGADAAAPEHGSCPCPCHGRSSEPGIAVQVLAPCTIMECALGDAGGHPRWAARVLDHPPHLTA